MNDSSLDSCLTNTTFVSFEDRMQAMDQKRNVLSIERIDTLVGNESQYVKPHRIHYRLNGKCLTWDCIKVHDSVSVVIFNKTSKKLVFVRQFRPAVAFAYLCSNIDSLDTNALSDHKINDFNKLLDKRQNIGYTLELCAGIIDKEGKTPKQIAREEVEEETGYEVELEYVLTVVCNERNGSLRFISSFRSGVGVSGSLQHLFYCEITNETPKGKGGGIGDEQIDVIELTIEETKKLLFCEDSEAELSRPASMLFSITWFIYKYLPTL